MDEPLRRRLEEAGLGRHVAALEELSEQAARVSARPADESRMPVGCSKHGGRPDLPAGVRWPRWRGRPLGFLLQVNLADLAATAAPALLPPEGVLCFFHDAGQATWGAAPADRGSWRVLFAAGAAGGLRRRDFPPDLAPAGRYPACEARFSDVLTFPAWQSIALGELGMTRAEGQAYLCFLQERSPENLGIPAHQILGHPRPLLDDMQVQCQLVSGGVDLTGSVDFADPRVRDLLAGSPQWRLLLQLDSDCGAGTCWHDCGCLYFWIRRADLAAGRFDRTWMVCQAD